ncbi:LPS export ABC transporter ATP-binding protein [Candidatus Acetothermia bacterium]|nr:LPS export ABC transporter ATP-binding protein [Candidatus Acetothermia bacterium]MBI3460819.1 LPS export ABC transporter ATP-binding protein [Candidatus Acetothermia bacterium]MBI3658875.1 LPS export ABC transporter ATP-binding protein [Candidatus Acetothermia bacterium]
MILRAENLVKSYGPRRVVDGVSLQVESGQIIGLLGPNGAGKTTTFFMMTGLIAHESGEISLDEAPIGHLPFYKRARRGIHYLPQEPSIFRKRSVFDNLRLTLENQNHLSATLQTTIETLLKKLDLERLRDQRADTLSSGERRRVEIARALATSPKFILLDEPFSGIDPISVEGIQKIIRQLATEEHIGVIVTDHNVREALRVTDYNYLLNLGKILLVGKPEEIANDPVAKRFYLGENFQL